MEYHSIFMAVILVCFMILALSYICNKASEIHYNGSVYKRQKSERYHKLLSKHKNKISEIPRDLITDNMIKHLILCYRSNLHQDIFEINIKWLINFYLKYIKHVNPFDFTYCTLTGTQFCKLIQATNIELVRLTNLEELHRRMHYVDGVNVDIEPFYPNDNCSKGGLYFIPSYHINRWTNYNSGIGEMVWKRKVTILKDSLVYIEENKFKTNKFLLGKRTPILELLKH